MDKEELRRRKWADLQVKGGNAVATTVYDRAREGNIFSILGWIPDGSLGRFE
jgi:hypothetical protein